MQLTPLQLEIQKIGADKSLSMGCLIQRYVGITDQLLYYFDRGNYCEYGLTIGIEGNFFQEQTTFDNFEKILIIGHTITYSRLSYLYRSQKSKSKIFMELTDKFIDNPELYNQSVLERPEELNLLVLSFLKSICETQK